MSGVMLFVPKLNGSRTVRSMVSNMKKSYGVPFCAYDLSLEENAVKSINCRNHVTGRIPFVSIAKVVETRSVLALFTNHQHLVAFDRAKLTSETRAQILQAIEAGNPSVEKHLLKKK